MSGLLDKLLGAFLKRDQPAGPTSPNVLLTPEQISARLHHRPIRCSTPTVFPVTEPARPVVKPESLPIPNFTGAGSTADGAHQLQVEPQTEFETRVDVELADDDHTDLVPVAIEPAPACAKDISLVDVEDEPSVVDAPIAEPIQVRPTPVARSSTEILAEFNDLMQRHFGREEPKPEPAAPDVLKILGLDKGEPISTLAGAPLPVAVPVFVSPPTTEVEAIRLNIEVKSITETAPEAEVITEPVDTVETGQAAASETTAVLSWRVRTVSEIILEGACSARLANCISANQDFFSEWTVGEALDDRAGFTAALMKVWSLGRKTAVEALDALDAFALDPRCKAQEPAEVAEQLVADPVFALVPARLDAQLSKVLGDGNLSVRLANVAASGQLDGLTVGDFVLDPGAVRKRLLVCKNAGRKTTDEAIKFLAAHVASLALPEVGHEAPLRTGDAGSERLSTGAWIRQELASLPPKQVEVLHSRYGLEGGTPQTLQEIAERVHVTRERVRQVEDKALRRLRGNGRSHAAFGRYVTEEREAQWTILFGPESTIPDGEVSERFRRLDPWFRLAIDVLYVDRRVGYLNANAHRTATGWFRSSDEADERQKLDHVIGNILCTYQMPMPLGTLKEIAPTVMATLPAEGDNWTLGDGYLFIGHVGSKARRTGHMHAIARRIAQAGVFDIGTLIIEYRSEFPEDECGSRMFGMQADEAPHLFVPLFDGIWLCLDHDSRQLERLPAPPFERRQVVETHFTEGSLGDLLIRKLAQFGPQRAIDLRRTVIDSAPGSFSESSIGAVLISNPCFRRAAPGVFGLYGAATPGPGRIDVHLVEDRHCRLYCHARHSGAPQDYYPLWGAAYEMRLATWAQRHAPVDLYRSLMAVVEPETWPAPTETIKAFQALRSKEGRWEIGAARRLPLGHRFLDSKQFLSALTHLVVFGWISWIGVNRATGAKPDAHDAADVLAFFIMTGLVEPESDWQAPHHPTDLAKRLFLEAKWERHLHGGESSGGEDVFGRLRSALYEVPPTASRGWVGIQDFTTAMIAWQSNGIWMGKAFGGAQNRQPGINAEQSFESDDWDSVFGG